MSKRASHPAGTPPPGPRRKPSPKAFHLIPERWRAMAARAFLDPPERHDGHAHAAYPWHRVLWLTGVDYFSTLGYQPGIAFLAAGLLSPVATAILVVVTLLGALPTYMQVSRRSFTGQGSLAMLERLVHGWKAKLLVLVLLGFAATDFVITMTLSAADAAQHAVENPLLAPFLGHSKLPLTMVLLVLLAGVFMAGFREALGMAVAVGAPYIALNVVVILRGGWEVLAHPELHDNYAAGLHAQGDWTSLFLASALLFPKLALGLSGFETGVSVMPLLRPERGHAVKDEVDGRVRATHKLLSTAAVMMSVLLLGSSYVTTVIIPAAEFQPGGQANGRALAYLAHALLGHGFGTVYDALTILILWFAGASALAGLLSLIPRYLPRFGMAPTWATQTRPLVLILLGINLAVTWIFKADVDAQGGAYATGVLVLILSAAVAVALASWREAAETADPRAVLPTRLRAAFFAVVAAVFTFTLGDNILERPDGVIIASIFCLAILAVSALSRSLRATEMRVEKLNFGDARSEELWNQLKGKKVSLVPLRSETTRARQRKGAEIRKYYNVGGQLAFLHVHLRDDRSEFSTALNVYVGEDDEVPGAWRISVTGAVATANTVAYISEQLDPVAVFLGLTQENKMVQSFKYLLFGEGEVGILVYEILVRYWASTPEDDVRPLIFLMSD